MDNIEKLYLNGYLFGQFKKGECLTTYLKVLNSIFARDIKDGFCLESKYAHSHDLRPNAYSYDESILNILFESDVPNFIKKSLGYDLHLAHVQVRVAKPFPVDQESRSYMEWHRDTHFYDGKLGGNAPPVYKIIFYPEFNGTKETPLMVVPGTHLNILSDKTQDYQQLRFKKSKSINTSPADFLFFNTSMFHSTLPAHKNGTLRIIYNFCLESQLSKYKEQSELHNLYKEKLKE